MKSFQEISLRDDCGGVALNKLMGFYELRAMQLPAIPWKEYRRDQKLDSNVLWTIRSAVFRGDDLNLPRKVGVTSDEATKFADELCSKMKDKGMVIYYPYFVANKSGTLEVKSDKVIIEAVKNDLWNLVTFSKKDVTYQISDGEIIIDGNASFLQEKEKNELLSYCNEIKRMFREEILEGKGILLEWSYARSCGINGEPVGEEYLVFYEIRTV